MNVYDINSEFEEFQFDWAESYTWGAKILKRNEKVVAFKMTEDCCYVLLKSKIKFFVFRFLLDDGRVKRIKILKTFISGKVTICEDKEYNLFKKELLLQELKND